MAALGGGGAVSAIISGDSDAPQLRPVFVKEPRWAFAAVVVNHNNLKVIKRLLA